MEMKTTVIFQDPMGIAMNPILFDADLVADLQITLGYTLELRLQYNSEVIRYKVLVIRREMVLGIEVNELVARCIPTLH